MFKGSGHGDNSAKMLKLTASVLHIPLEQVFNKSKLATVTPFLKKNDPLVKKKNGSMNMLTARPAAKVFESQVLKNKICAFRSTSSCQTVLVRLGNLPWTRTKFNIM